MKILMQALLFLGVVLLLGSLIAHAVDPLLPVPTLFFIGSVGGAFLCWHNALRLLQKK